MTTVSAPVLRALCDHGGLREVAPAHAIEAILGSDLTQRVWLDIARAGDAEGEILREKLGFHPLAVEDCLRGKQRPKLERYPGYQFLVLYATSVRTGKSHVRFHEVHLFIGRHFIVSVHDGTSEAISSLWQRWQASPESYPSVDHLSHALIDSIVDGYFPASQTLAEAAERLEEHLLQQDWGGDIQRFLGTRREMLLMRKRVAPLRDVLGSLLLRDLPQHNPELLPYYQDVRDHIVRVTEDLDTAREMLSASLDAHLSVSSNQLNITMRRMTAWSIILMSVTLVAGIYGMNFEQMPELSWRWGYPASLLMMLGLGGTLVRFFQKRGWL